MTGQPAAAPMTPRDHALHITRELQIAGHEAWWVGGAVRDQLLGKTPSDIDIATSAKPEEIEHLFPRTAPVGRKFGVVLVIAGGHAFQVATFRSDGLYQDGRRPETVHFASAKEDALRRDFTVNGLFWNPLTQELKDWVGGQQDLADHVIRTIGDPWQRFAEDHLRLLRAVRFATQLGFHIHPDTLAAIRALGPKLSSISPERVRDELEKTLRPPHAAAGLRCLHDAGLLNTVLPEVARLQGVAQPPEHHPEGDVLTHTLKALEYLPPNASPTLTWATLLHDCGKPDTFAINPTTGKIRFHGHEKTGATLAISILERLRFPNRFIDQVAFIVEHHMQFKDLPGMRGSTRRRMALRPTFPEELELHRADCLASHGRLDHYWIGRDELDRVRSAPTIQTPLVTGADLLSMGWSAGPDLGRTLSQIRELQLSDHLKTREDALDFLRTLQTPPDSNHS